MCPARWKTRRGRGSRPRSNLSLSLVGAWNRQGCSGVHPPAPPGHCSRVVTGGSAGPCRPGASSPARQPAVLGQLEETGAGEPALHSNNNRLPAHWRPCWGPGLEPERPPHSTPLLAKHVFLFSKGGQEARTHPESTRELISTDRPDCQGASWGGGDRSRARARPTWETILAKRPGSESEEEQQGPGCSRDKAPNLKSAFTEKRRPQGLPGYKHHH